MDSHNNGMYQRTDLWWLGDGGRDELGVWEQQMQTIIYRMDKQQGPTFYTGNYIQYPMLNYNGKEQENVYIYIYVYMKYISIYIHKLHKYIYTYI